MNFFAKIFAQLIILLYLCTPNYENVLIIHSIMKKIYTYPQTDVMAVQGEKGVLLLPSDTGLEPAPEMRNNAPHKF